jgi:hypothetical protein
VAPLTRAGCTLGAVAAALLAGCSFGTDDPGETVEDFRDAVASGDMEAACEEIVPDAQILFYPEAVVEDGITVGYANGCDDPGSLVLDEDATEAASGTEVTSSSTDGDGAEVVTETSAGERLVFSLVRIDENWRLMAPAEVITSLDSDAKTGARKAQTAIESYATANESFNGADAAALRDVEPTLADYELSTVTASGDTYTVGVTSASGTEFTIERDRQGTITSSCNAPELGGCAAGGVWTELAPAAAP